VGQPGDQERYRVLKKVIILLAISFSLSPGLSRMFLLALFIVNLCIAGPLHMLLTFEKPFIVPIKRI